MASGGMLILPPVQTENRIETSRVSRSKNALDPLIGKVGAGESRAGFRKHGQSVTGHARPLNGGQFQTETLPGQKVVVPQFEIFTAQLSD
jgi:hypothetical protein